MPKPKNNQTVVVGLSGGVDSSVAAYLLKKQGYDVIGVHMRHLQCTDTSDVESVCKTLNIPYHFVDYTKEFKEHVIERCQNEINRGLTPNPCCYCNPEIKFKMLLDFADKINADYIATGHFANASSEMSLLGSKSSVTGKSIFLKRAKDSNKDQSYFLCGLKLSPYC